MPEVPVASERDVAPVPQVKTAEKSLQRKNNSPSHNLVEVIRRYRENRTIRSIADKLNSADGRRVEEANVLIHTFLDKHNLPAEEMLESWRETSLHADSGQVMSERDIDPKVFALVCERNLRSISFLERQRQGSSRTLNENFGIRHFGRYPSEMLLAQCEAPKEKGYGGAFLFADFDYNGIMYGNGAENPTGITFTMLRNTFKQLQELGYDAPIFEQRDKRGVGRSLLKAYRRYGQLNFVIFSGHGEDSGGMLYLGTPEPKSRLALDSTEIFIQDTASPISKKLIDRVCKPTATFILRACNLGKPFGLAERFAGNFKRETIASPDEGVLTDLVPRKDGDELIFHANYTDINSEGRRVPVRTIVYGQRQTKRKV